MQTDPTPRPARSFAVDKGISRNPVISLEDILTLSVGTYIVKNGGDNGGVGDVLFEGQSWDEREGVDYS
jgi:hypothetical protein